MAACTSARAVAGSDVALLGRGARGQVSAARAEPGAGWDPSSEASSLLPNANEAIPQLHRTQQEFRREELRASAEIKDTGGPKGAAMSGHDQWVADSQLVKIMTIPCLQKMQNGVFDPNCGHAPEKRSEAVLPSSPGGWFVGHYPSYKDNATCYSEPTDGTFERFCDPDRILNVTERKIVQKKLRQFRANHQATCRVAGTGNTEEYPFFLGVALLETLPSTELDQESMEEFGQSVLAQWGMLNGRNCPNAAVLVLASDFGEATVAAASCEFICADRGGGSVIVRMKARLAEGQRDSPFLAVMDGIAEFKEVYEELKGKNSDRGGMLNAKPELSEESRTMIDKVVDVLEVATGGYVHEVPVEKKYHDDVMTYLSKKEGTWVILTRLAGFCVLLAGLTTTCIFLHWALSSDVALAVKRVCNDLVPSHIDPHLRPRTRYATFEERYEGVEGYMDQDG